MPNNGISMAADLAIRLMVKRGVGSSKPPHRETELAVLYSPINRRVYDWVGGAPELCQKQT